MLNEAYTEQTPKKTQNSTHHIKNVKQKKKP